MRTSRTARLIDVAKAAGVSLGAASTVINGGKTSIQVGEESRRRILEAARQLKYRPNLTARALSGKSTRLIGIVNAVISQYSSAVFVNHILSVAANYDYHTLLDIVHVGNHVIFDKGVEGLENLLARHPDGLIFMGIPDQEVMKHTTVPNVTIGFKDNRHSDFSFDLEAGGYMAGLHLAKHGRRRVLFICTSQDANKEKLFGLRRAWQESGFAPDAVVVIERVLNDIYGVEDLILREIENGADAAFCSNDFLAARLLAFLHDRKIHVPQEIAVIGFDGDIFSSIITPSLTTVVQPFQECAERAVKLLIERIEGKESGRKRKKNIKLLPGFFTGQSCGCETGVLPIAGWSRDMLLVEEFFGTRISKYEDFILQHQMKKE